MLSVPLLLNSDLKASVDTSRVDVRNATVYIEYAAGDLKKKVLEEFRKHEDAKILKLPFTTVNVIEKHLDTVTGVDDLERGDHTQE